MLVSSDVLGRVSGTLQSRIHTGVAGGTIILQSEIGVIAKILWSADERRIALDGMITLCVVHRIGVEQIVCDLMMRTVQPGAR